MTEQTFKVGDKVNHRSFGRGEIAFGPFTHASTGDGEAYIMTEDATGNGSFVVSEALTALPTFAVGDTVTHRLLGTVEITYGPYTDTLDQVRYMIRLAGGSEQPMLPEMLTALPTPALVPVGTRVRIDRAEYGEEAHGKTGVVTSNTETWRPRNSDLHPYEVRIDDGRTVLVAELTPVDESASGFEYKGVTYERSATYRDNDGDYWKFARPASATDGDAWMCHVDVRGTHGDFRYGDETLEAVVRSYGPLTKHTA
ncbi:phiSA1p31-related protein [Streptomyces sp. NPDC002346]